METLPVSIIAKYFIKKSNDSNRVITNKKLQKLVYYGQAWNLVLNGKPIFKEPIEAWVHGPAINSLYESYKQFSYNPIVEQVTDDDIKNIPQDIKAVLEEVWKVYGNYDGDYLELLTHSEEPWQKAREGLEIAQSSNNEISIELMREFYSKKNEKYEQDSTTTA